MWQYRGEWFWGLDRLHFLTQRLQAQGAVAQGTVIGDFQPSALPVAIPAPNTPVEFWFSFRSPYSYLAAIELLRRRKFGKIPNLIVRPILPMVMRGLPVPLAKRFYIVRDAKRCADALNIPFGCISDPVGEGVLRLLTLFPREAPVDQQLLYCAAAGQAVWAEGLDARRDDVLQSVIQRAGLAWEDSKGWLVNGIDTVFAEANLEALFEAGLWGVPSFRCGALTTWGQDRLWMVDQVLFGVEGI
ncbi:hypothetical protein BJY04DRAFT_186772 [Aspergillus karnatakaensis]|uniref:uncharacterized protein n=1 Tax=Aspergillus karnatakaensis TaxID=1810916 RepID=UPI003CCD1038